jgi:hypothetical protein
MSDFILTLDKWSYFKMKASKQLFGNYINSLITNYRNDNKSGGMTIMIHLDENNEFKYTQTVSEEEFNNLIDGNLFKLFASR